MFSPYFKSPCRGHPISLLLFTAHKLWKAQLSFVSVSIYHLWCFSTSFSPRLTPAKHIASILLMVSEFSGRFFLLLLAFPTSLAAQLGSWCCPSSSEKPSMASWSLILFYFCTPGPPPLSDSLPPEGTPPRLTALRTIHMPMTPKWTSLLRWIHSSRLVFPEWTLSGHLKESPWLPSPPQIQMCLWRHHRPPGLLSKAPRNGEYLHSPLSAISSIRRRHWLHLQTEVCPQCDPVLHLHCHYSGPQLPLLPSAVQSPSHRHQRDLETVGVKPINFLQTSPSTWTRIQPPRPEQEAPMLYPAHLFNLGT